MNKSIQIKSEVLRYLGHKDQEVDTITDKIIDESIEEIKQLAKERYVYKFFEISSDGKDLKLIDGNLKLKGRNIRDHLSRSKSCLLMAVTLGHKVDTKIRYYEKISMVKAMILDACATAFIEGVCDELHGKIEGELDAGNRLTSRYSPGYGDLPIDIQGDFLSALDAERSIGLNATSHSILIPRKSVTAIAGVIRRGEKTREKSCRDCNKYNTCNFSRGGKKCGY